MAPQTADVKLKLTDYEQMLELKRELYKNADESVQIGWIERIVHIFRLNIEIQDVLLNAIPPVEKISVGDAATLLPDLIDDEKFSIFTTTSVHYLSIFERMVRYRWRELFTNLVVKNHFTLYNNEYKKLLHVITDRKDKLSKTALKKINTILSESINKTSEYFDEICVKAMEIKEITRSIFDDVSDINYYSHKMILDSKQNCNFDVKNGNGLRVISKAADQLSSQTISIFKGVKEIEKLLGYIDIAQKCLPDKIIEFMSINDLE